LTVIRFAAPGAATAVIPDAGTATIDSNASHDYVLVDDMESGSATGPIALNMGNTALGAGYWWSARSTGNPANAMSPDPFSLADLPAPHETMSGVTSTRAAHLTCSLADLYGWCEDGFNFAAPEAPFDISAHTGIVFWGMSPLGGTVKVQIWNDDTAPAGGKCGQGDASADQCWDSFASYVTLTNTWQRFEVKFSDLRQDGWGHPVPSGIFDPATARGIAFEILGPTVATGPAVTADFWIDDIYFE
jgi:hypothetical protein